MDCCLLATDWIHSSSLKSSILLATDFNMDCSLLATDWIHLSSMKSSILLATDFNMDCCLLATDWIHLSSLKCSSGSWFCSGPLNVPTCSFLHWPRPHVLFDSYLCTSYSIILACSTAHKLNSITDSILVYLTLTHPRGYKPIQWSCFTCLYASLLHTSVKDLFCILVLNV